MTETYQYAQTLYLFGSSARPFFLPQSFPLYQKD